jgi:hypothetical protein
LAAVTLRGQFRQIDPAKSSIVLVEGGKRILPTFSESLAGESQSCSVRGVKNPGWPIPFDYLVIACRRTSSRAAASK